MSIKSKLPWIPDIQLIELVEANMRLDFRNDMDYQDFWEENEEEFQKMYGDQIKALKERIK